MSRLVSVLMATYDGERFVAEAVGSVLGQTYEAVELIVCDDGSHDGTVALLHELAAGAGGRMRVLEQENAGVSAARNRAAAEARGEYLGVLDQDDAYEETMLARQVARLESEPELGFVYGDSLVVDADGVTRGRRGDELAFHEGRIFHDLLRGNFVPLEALLFRADLFRELGGFRTGVRYLEDWDLCLRAARLRPVGFTDEALGRYRVHDANVSHRMDALLAEYLTLLDELAQDASLAAEDARVVEEERRRRHAELAWYALRRFELPEARRWLAREPLAHPPLKLSLLLPLLRVLPAPLGRRLVGLLPRRRLHGIR